MKHQSNLKRMRNKAINLIKALSSENYKNLNNKSKFLMKRLGNMKKIRRHYSKIMKN
jgi:hypothetical protein